MSAATCLSLKSGVTANITLIFVYEDMVFTIPKKYVANILIKYLILSVVVGK